MLPGMGEIGEPQTLAAACCASAPLLSVLMRVVMPVIRSCKKTSSRPLVSPLTRFDAPLVAASAVSVGEKVTVLALAECEAAVLGAGMKFNPPVRRCYRACCVFSVWLPI